jgi:hypothetical protein
MSTVALTNQLSISSPSALGIVPLIAVEFDRKPTIEQEVDSTPAAARGDARHGSLGLNLAA